jgi:chitodextrinase
MLRFLFKNIALALFVFAANLVSAQVSCTNVGNWVTTTAYNTGENVVYLGKKYSANWWTQGNQPDLNNGPSGSGQPWLLVGTCASQSSINTTPATLNNFTSFVSSSSSNQVVSLTGSNLTVGSTLTITSSPHFEISFDQNTTFTSSLSLVVPATGGITATNVYIQYNPSTVGSDNGTITFAVGGITLKTITVTGTASASPTWNTIGNNNTNSTNFLGTTTNVPLIFKANNIEALRINPTGIITSGFLPTDDISLTSYPYYQMTIKGRTNVIGDDNAFDVWSADKNGAADDGFRQYLTLNNGVFPGTTKSYGSIGSNSYGSNSNSRATTLLLQENAGFLGVGTFTNTPGAKFAVNGNSLFLGDVKLEGFLRVKNKISANEVFVTANPLTDAFPDYVFDQNYKLMPLDTLASYISINKHLPEIPSASEIKEQGQISLGEMNNLLLKKVEELSLYIIEQDKLLKAQQAQQALIDAQQQLLEERIKALENLTK